MKTKSSISFRVIKSSWGIFIRVTASATTSKNLEENYGDLRFNNFHIRLQSDIRLSKEEKDVFINGLKSALDEHYSETPTLINIEEISFIDTDFQIEGLYWAARMLIADLLNIEFQIPRVEFDRQANKYIFFSSAE